MGPAPARLVVVRVNNDVVDRDAKGRLSPLNSGKINLLSTKSWKADGGGEAFGASLLAPPHTPRLGSAESRSVHQ